MRDKDRKPKIYKNDDVIKNEIIYFEIEIANLEDLVHNHNRKAYLTEKRSKVALYNISVGYIW